MNKSFICLACGTLNDKKHHGGLRKFCNQKCQQVYMHNEYITRWKNGLEESRKGLQTSSHIRRYIVDKFENICQGCSQTSVHNGKPLTMQLEHIDGDSSNNKEENLSLLCPNCHTQTEFYGSKNLGRGRSSILKEMRK